jgi:N-acetylglucosamine malate deacetylase 1
MPSQFSDEDSWTYGRSDNIPEDEATRMKNRVDALIGRNENIANNYRELLNELYGEEASSAIRYAEAFQLSEFGRQVSVEDLKLLFPSFE